MMDNDEVERIIKEAFVAYSRCYHIGVHKFSKNLGTISKLQEPEGWHEENSILRTHNIRRYRTKFSCLGDVATGNFSPFYHGIWTGGLKTSQKHPTRQ
jgi:hypothetical protein